MQRVADKRNIGRVPARISERRGAGKPIDLQHKPLGYRKSNRVAGRGNGEHLADIAAQRRIDIDGVEIARHGSALEYGPRVAGGGNERAGWRALHAQRSGKCDPIGNLHGRCKRASTA